MKFLLLLLLSLNVEASCRVFIPEKVFYHDSGIVIDFEFDSLLISKGYQEVFNSNQADIVLTFKGIEDRSGKLNKAVAIFIFDDQKIEIKKTCLSSMCSIYDYRVSFFKAYKQLEKVVPRCPFEEI